MSSQRKRSDPTQIDAVGSRADAEQLRSFVEEDLKKEARFIISTHYFSDHLAGAELLSAGHRYCARELFADVRVFHRRNLETVLERKLFAGHSST